MLSFENDYSTGATVEILERLCETNYEATPGYGSDNFTKSAKEKIKKVCGIKDGDVTFLVGGTQTNSVVISTILKDYEGVIAVDSGHINTHEAGAIEHAGHKVLTIKGENGKLKASDLKNYLIKFYKDRAYEHMVIPGMVYISYPTEYGTIYTKKELSDIYKVCKSYELPLFIDGARLGYGLMSKKSDMSIRDIARLSDVFYIGGTKVGAFCGEAVVFTEKKAPTHYVTSIKKRGALLAKGRFLGIQFDTLFNDNLYFKISSHAISMAEELKKVFKKKGYQLYVDSPTNQQFVIINKKKVKELQKKVAFTYWEEYDDKNDVVRFVTSWSTSKEDIEKLEKML